MRVDALGEGDDASLGIDARSKVEARLRQLEGGSVRASAPNGAPEKLIEVVQSGNGAAGYSAASDMVLDKKEKKKKKRDREELSPDEAAAKKARKAEKKARKLAEAAAAGGDGEKPKKKKKKKKDCSSVRKARITPRRRHALLSYTMIRCLDVRADRRPMFFLRTLPCAAGRRWVGMCEMRAQSCSMIGPSSRSAVA